MNGKHKSVVEFESIHGQPKLKRLERELEAERAKVQNIASERKPVTVVKTAGNAVTFGVIGDTHYGSLYQFPEGVKSFYKQCEDAGVKEVLHAGDVLDGWRMYKGQEFELADIGFEDQLQRMIDDAPAVDGIRTRFITGNHDGSFTALTGINVGKAIAEKRKDWIHEGIDHATIRYQTADGVYDVMLLHPGGGTSYALSYRVQKTIEQLEGGTKPNMICIGHYHKAEFIPSYRNIAALQTGTFQWQTPYMVRKSLSAHVGGWIVTVHVGDSWNTVRAEFIAFYK